MFATPDFGCLEIRLDFGLAVSGFERNKLYASGMDFRDNLVTQQKYGLIIKVFYRLGLLLKA